MGKKRIALFGTILLGFALSAVVYAVGVNARLKSGIESNILYYSESIATLSSMQGLNKNGFKTEYDDRFVAVIGEIRADSVGSKGKELKLYDPQQDAAAIIDCSSEELISTVQSLEVGDIITVYGQLEVKGFRDDSYQINAKSITKGETGLQKHLYSDRNGTVYQGKQISDLTTDGRIQYSIPESWDSQYVVAPLTNNGVKGYQYFLNAVSPQQVEYPEIFYIFYFDNGRYLKDPPKNPSDSTIMNIEEAIIKDNICKDQVDKIKITEVKDTNGNVYHYCNTTYPKQGKVQYRLEFVFVPDEKGIVCMLYLYYPKEEAIRHVDEVVYVIESFME
ncbi:MAG: hypothetical protein ACI4FY_00095 [Acetatifactor sp.]